MGQRVTVTTPSERELLISRDFNAPRRLVFRALSEPELVRQWLLGPPGWTMPVCEIDFRVGGKYRYVWRNEDGRDMGMGGTYREIARPERVVATELFDEDWTGGETLNTTTLTEESAKTRMDILVLYASKEARDGALATGMTKGMEIGFDRLDTLVARLAVGETS